MSDFKILVRRAQKYLLARGTYPFSGDARTRNSINDRPMPVPKGKSACVILYNFAREIKKSNVDLVKTRTIGGMFKRKKAKESNKKKSSIIPTLETLLEVSRKYLRFNSSDGRVVKASAAVILDSGLIQSVLKPMTLKMLFSASLLDLQH